MLWAAPAPAGPAAAPAAARAPRRAGAPRPALSIFCSLSRSVTATNAASASGPGPADRSAGEPSSSAAAPASAAPGGTGPAAATAADGYPAAPARTRRVRYAGTYPRAFAAKYKELDPLAFPETAAKVRAKGSTPAGSHVPILAAEILRILAPQRGDVAVDCTLGFGGHAARLLRAVLPAAEPDQDAAGSPASDTPAAASPPAAAAAAVSPAGCLLALDVDPLELPKAEARLRAILPPGAPAEALRVRQTNFAGLSGALAAEGLAGGADVLLADLGLSSMQIDNPERGFTFKADGPLDLRMNPRKGRPASEVLASLSEAALTEVLSENADEPHAAAIARALTRGDGGGGGSRGRAGASPSSSATTGPIVTTWGLAGAVRAALPRGTPPADADAAVRRVFQALRIVVNDEFAALETFLLRLPDCLKPGGRVAILTFHSGEDRRVKKAFKEGLAGGEYACVARDVLRPGPVERRANPRSGPAKLRWAVRSGGEAAAARAVEAEALAIQGEHDNSRVALAGDKEAAEAAEGAGVAAGAPGRAGRPPASPGPARASVPARRVSPAGQGPAGVPGRPRA